MNPPGSIADLGDGVISSTTPVTLFTVRDGSSVWLQVLTLVNTDASNRTCNVYLNRSGTRRRIAPKDLTLRPGYVVAVDDGYSLQAGDSVEADASVANVIEWTANGLEAAT